MMHESLLNRGLLAAFLASERIFFRGMHAWHSQELGTPGPHVKSFRTFMPGTAIAVRSLWLLRAKQNSRRRVRSFSTCEATCSAQIHTLWTKLCSRLMHRIRSKDLDDDQDGCLSATLTLQGETS